MIHIYPVVERALIIEERRHIDNEHSDNCPAQGTEIQGFQESMYHWYAIYLVAMQSRSNPENRSIALALCHDNWQPHGPAHAVMNQGHKQARSRPFG